MIIEILFTKHLLLYASLVLRMLHVYELNLYNLLIEIIISVSQVRKLRHRKPKYTSPRWSCYSNS